MFTSPLPLFPFPTGLCPIFNAFFEQNVIEINRPPLPIYQTVIEKTRGLALRTQALGAAMSRTGQTGQTGQQGGLGKSETQAQVVAVS